MKNIGLGTLVLAIQFINGIVIIPIIAFSQSATGWNDLTISIITNIFQLIGFIIPFYAAWIIYRRDKNKKEALVFLITILIIGYLGKFLTLGFLAF